MRAFWQHTANTVLVMWPCRSVSAKRSFSLVLMAESDSLGTSAFVDKLEFRCSRSVFIIAVPSRCFPAWLETV
jgi:hypothetical protein